MADLSHHPSVFSLLPSTFYLRSSAFYLLPKYLDKYERHGDDKDYFTGYRVAIFLKRFDCIHCSGLPDLRSLPDIYTGGYAHCG